MWIRKTSKEFPKRKLQNYHEGWNYISKSIWKEKVRDVNKEPELSEETDKLELTKTKTNKMSKSAKRHLRKANK